ncbi:hypothetical protein VNO80_12803 [Phaseolus coccineus]|uniref:Uncharacterized protein n=1 Tax=Phaseolus coccineus TaxID=3886 RepID=A0AAN9N056_PHACN
MCASLSVTVSVCGYIYSIMMKREKRECRGRDVAAGLRRLTVLEMQCKEGVKKKSEGWGQRLFSLDLYTCVLCVHDGIQLDGWMVAEIAAL